MEIISKLPYDLQYYIYVKILGRYKERNGKLMRQIDMSKYEYVKNKIRNYHIYFASKSNVFISKILDNTYNIENRYEDDNDDKINFMMTKHNNGSISYIITTYRLKPINIENIDMIDDIHMSYNDNYYWDIKLLTKYLL